MTVRQTDFKFITLPKIFSPSCGINISEYLRTYFLFLVSFRNILILKCKP